MQVKAKLNHLRIAPRKIRLVADMIRGEQASKAKTLLKFSLKKGCLNIGKLLDSAVANASNNFQLDKENLFIKEIKVDEGPKLKRWHPMSKGRAVPIQKKTSHITLILEGKVLQDKEEKKEIKVKELKNKKQVKKDNQATRTESKASQKANLKRVFRRKAI